MNDINHLDPNDEGLQAVMGSRFQDLSKDPAPKKTPVQADRKERQAEKVPEAHWEPVPHTPTQMERLKACVKSASVFSILCLLVFYWQQTGQMLPSASVPCMMVCCGGAMWHVGRACR